MLPRCMSCSTACTSAGRRTSSRFLPFKSVRSCVRHGRARQPGPCKVLAAVKKRAADFERSYDDLDFYHDDFGLDLPTAPLPPPATSTPERGPLFNQPASPGATQTRPASNRFMRDERSMFPPLGGYQDNFRQGYRSNRRGGEDDDDIEEVEERRPVRTDTRVLGKEYTINEKIRAREVRVVTGDNEALGVIPLAEALFQAQESKVDLILISEDAIPPVCKLQDFSKFKFDMEKRDKDVKKKQKQNVADVKEVKLRPVTGDGDVQVKLKLAQKFLEKGNKVKVTMTFEGRELMFKDQGRRMLTKFIEDCVSVALPEGPVSVRGTSFTAMLAPIKR